VKALVTGGAGFIGSNLTRALLARGVEVTVLDDLSTGRKANLNRMIVRFVPGSILDPEALRDACRGVDLVFHLAAQVSVPQSIEDPDGTHETNGTGTMRVLEAARWAHAKRVVYASSCAVYGQEPGLPKREESPLHLPSPYAAAKYVGEVYGKCWGDAFGLEVVALRFFNVFGPRQPATGGYAAVIPAFVSRALAGRQLVVYGDGGQTRDFVFVDNVVEACWLAATVPGVGGRVFNVGTGVETSLLDLIRVLGVVLGQPPEIEHASPRDGDIRCSWGDLTKARSELGYLPSVDLEAGLRATVAWHRRSE
jgi:nucleoside-diphosphate-sugar epimerase